LADGRRKQQGMRTEYHLQRVEHELAVLEAMAAEMEPYLKSNLLYWQLSPAERISPPPPMLTIGGALLRARRLEALEEEMTPELARRLEAASAELERTLAEWKAHAAQTMALELDARLNSWRRYVADCQARNQSCVTSYPNEAEKRTILALLLEKAADLTVTTAWEREVQGLDARFRQHFEPSEFIWDKRLEDAFPGEEFWWLYGRPEIPADGR
jgi:septal ring factor EnvC (AmiA/AmiB activator)